MLKYILAFVAALHFYEANAGYMTDDSVKSTLCNLEGEKSQICEGEDVACCAVRQNGTKNGLYTCCRDEWVCCGDCQHYCEKGFACNMTGEYCDVQGETTAWKSLPTRTVMPTKRHLDTPAHKELNPHSRFARGVKAESPFCNNGTGTLCREEFGGGCCPGKNSVCCTDNYSCCPTDSTCDTKIHVCYFY